MKRRRRARTKAGWGWAYFVSKPRSRYALSQWRKVRIQRVRVQRNPSTRIPMWGWAVGLIALALYAYKTRVVQAIEYSSALDFTTSPSVLRSTFLDYCKNNGTTDLQCADFSPDSITDLNQFVLSHPGLLPT